MQVIHQATEGIVKVWGTGKPKDTAYRLFTYLLLEDCKDGALIHNVVSGEMILLSPDEKQLLPALPCAYAPWMDALIAGHFIVPAENEDDKTVQKLRMAIQLLNRTKEFTAYTILPTSGCNARCFYCFESGTVHTNMTEETAKKAVDFIAAHHGDKPISLHWFGGEPPRNARNLS